MDFIRNFSSRTGGDFSIHLAPYHRTTAHPFRIATIGYIPAKKNWTDWTFDSHNFSFILEGTGNYHDRGTVVPVTAPCVLTQTPHVRQQYGPLDTWKELYLIYHAETAEKFIQRKFYSAEKPNWPISQLPVVSARIEELMGLLNRVEEPFVIDRIDLLCEMLILESLTCGGTHPMSREEKMVKDIERRMRRDLLAEYDFNDIANELGMHPATFRRYWEKYCPMTPGRFLSRLRLEDACKQLVETRLTIAEIAYALNFEDPLYFSRRFRNEFGCTASEYRLRNKGLLP